MQNSRKNPLEFLLLEKNPDKDTLSLLHQTQNACLPDNKWDIKSIGTLLANDFTHCFLVNSRTSCIGFSLFNMVGPEGEIISFGVTPEHRNKGYGKYIMQETIRHLKESAVENLYLEVSVENDPALRIYSALGFKKIGMRKKYYQVGDRKVDAIQMSLKV